METDGNNISSPLLAGGASRGEEWGTIFVVYALVSLQFLLAVSFGINAVFNSGIPHFELHSTLGLTICLISFLLWLVVQCSLLALSNHYPWNFVLFTLWSILFAITIGLSCSYFEGKGTAILEAIILMSVVTVTLTIYALFGAIGDFGFSLCQPCFLGLFLVVCLHVATQIFHDSGALSTSIYGVLAALLFCGHTFFAGNQIVKHHDIDIEGPISAVVHSYWTFLYYLKLTRDLQWISGKEEI